jgi:hypothetical protein
MLGEHCTFGFLSMTCDGAGIGPVGWAAAVAYLGNFIAHCVYSFRWQAYAKNVPLRDEERIADGQLYIYFRSGSSGGLPPHDHASLVLLARKRVTFVMIYGMALVVAILAFLGL